MAGTTGGGCSADSPLSAIVIDMFCLAYLVHSIYTMNNVFTTVTNTMHDIFFLPVSLSNP